MGRLEHILGRYEYDAGTFYQKMLDNAADYHEMEIRRMSRLTGNLLRSMDYPYIKAKRRNIIDHFDEDTMEYDWAANVLPLPCDQRYGEEEMRYIADSIREWEETKA